jgi:hypothetical protein
MPINAKQVHTFLDLLEAIKVINDSSWRESLVFLYFQERGKPIEELTIGEFIAAVTAVAAIHHKSLAKRTDNDIHSEPVFTRTGVQPSPPCSSQRAPAVQSEAGRNNKLGRIFPD